MRKCANISPYMRRSLVNSHIWLCNCSILNLLILYMKKFWISFLSVYVRRSVFIVHFHQIHFSPFLTVLDNFFQPRGLELFDLLMVWQISKFVKYLDKLCGFHFSRRNLPVCYLCWEHYFDLIWLGFKTVRYAVFRKRHVVRYWEKCLKLRKCASSGSLRYFFKTTI